MKSTKNSGVIYICEKVTSIRSKIGPHRTDHNGVGALEDHIRFNSPFQSFTPASHINTSHCNIYLAMRQVSLNDEPRKDI